VIFDCLSAELQKARDHTHPVSYESEDQRVVPQAQFLEVPEVHDVLWEGLQPVAMEMQRFERREFFKALRNILELVGTQIETFQLAHVA
jgi:hypothetical protein